MGHIYTIAAKRHICYKEYKMGFFSKIKIKNNPKGGGGDLLTSHSEMNLNLDFLV